MDDELCLNALETTEPDNTEDDGGYTPTERHVCEEPAGHDGFHVCRKPECGLGWRAQ